MWVEEPCTPITPHGALRYAMGCRCLFCTDAHVADGQEKAAAKAALVPRHGTVRCFRAGCTCTLCRVAAADYAYRLQQRAQARQAVA